MKDLQSLLAFVGFIILPVAFQLPEFDWVRESSYAASVAEVCRGYIAGYIATFGSAIFWKIVVTGKINDWLGVGFFDRTTMALCMILLLGFTFAVFYGSIWGPGMEWYGDLAAAVGAIAMSQGLLPIVSYIDGLSGTGSKLE